MFRLNHPAGHYGLLLLTGLVLFFPNLGGHTLWEVDEAHNAECAREMLDAGNWRVPTFNFHLRTDKPVLLYWLTMQAYRWFGVTEFAARFWSAVCGLGTMLVVYELGRRLFDRPTALAAGLVLGTSILFAVSSHAATPDALLIFFSTLALFTFWYGYVHDDPNWYLGFAASTALAVLAKGLVGLLLPSAVIWLFLLWERRLGFLWRSRFVVGSLLFGLIAIPWFVLVGVETRREFLNGFFFKHHVQRFQTPFEGHGGAFLPYLLYHPLALIAGFAPWCAFLGLTLWYGTGRRARADAGARSAERGAPSVAAYRFLWCWLAVWLVFFSVAGTKLPNYLLPAYPALALLTARFLVRWQAGALQPHVAWMGVAFGCLGLVGLIVGGGLLVASGWIPLPFTRGRELPGLGPWALAGLLLVVAAIWAWRCHRKNWRGQALGTVLAAATVFVALLAAFGPVAVEDKKVPRLLAQELAQHQVEPELRIICYQCYHPGLVFYTQRQMALIAAEKDAARCLESAHQTFLVIPAKHWEKIKEQVTSPHAVVARQWDLTRGREILLIVNRTTPAEVAAQAASSRHLRVDGGSR